MVAASRAIPSLFLTLPGGVLADRWDKRHIIRFSQLLLMINAIVLEVRGQDALGAALVLLLFASLLAFVLQKRWGLFTRR